MPPAVQREAMHIVLYQPEIAYNTGSVGRTCVALGAKLWLVRPLGFQIDDRRLRRAGLDYWRHLDWEAVADWETLMRRLGDRRPWFFTKKAQRCYTDVVFEPDAVLVFGGESQGLPPSMLATAGDRCVGIPIRPEVRSLNLSVAVAVAAYEVRRQAASASTASRRNPQEA